jgi:uncharacterized alpha/beta hydrolase family protein
MKKTKWVVIVIAIALGIACTHLSTQKQKIQKRLHKKEVSLPYVPSVFIDVSVFPGNLFEFLINQL